MEKKVSLVISHPEIAKEWHPWRNGDLAPEDVTCGSGRKVWWYLPYDDPTTGKHFEFEWQARVEHRVRGVGCPVFSGKLVWPGYNDLLSQRPDLAKEWHPERNGNLTPEKVTSGSGKLVWWYLPYDDPITGKHFEFEWQEKVYLRAKNGFGCPYLSSHLVWPGYNDLATHKPELVKEWHPWCNGELTPKDVTCGSARKVWWYLPYDDPITGKHFEFEWQETVGNRVLHNCKCPYLTSHRTWTGFNDLVTLRPDLAKEWHPYKNGELKPESVMPMSNKKVWWLVSIESETGVQYELEWKECISSRARNEVAHLPMNKAWSGYNDLASLRPDLAEEWHPWKNGSLLPSDVTVGSERIVWWYLPYDDPISGEHFDFEWRARISHRVHEQSGCPYFSGEAWPGYNDLESQMPELAKEWHPTKNKRLRPNGVLPGSTMKVWWLCEKGHEWRTTVRIRAIRGCECPYCRRE